MGVTHIFKNSPGVELVAGRCERDVRLLLNAHDKARFVAPSLVRRSSPALLSLQAGDVDVAEVVLEAEMALQMNSSIPPPCEHSQSSISLASPVVMKPWQSRAKRS